VAKPSQRTPDPSKPSSLRVFPMSLRSGDIRADEVSDWRVIGHPFTTGDGKTVNARVESVRQTGGTQARAWGGRARDASR
jgi:hypothetical protein